MMIKVTILAVLVLVTVNLSSALPQYTINDSAFNRPTNQPNRNDGSAIWIDRGRDFPKNNDGSAIWADTGRDYPKPNDGSAISADRGRDYTRIEIDPGFSPQNRPQVYHN